MVIAMRILITAEAEETYRKPGWLSNPATLSGYDKLRPT